MICCNCKLDKHTSEFEKYTDENGKIKSWKTCNECYQNETAPAWKRNSYKRGELEKDVNSSRKSFNYKQYGITVEQYNELYQKQKGCCAICGIHQSELKKSLCIDHDHSTGKIRGLLCSNHNTGIGLLNDNYEMILKAAIYLHKHKESKEDLNELLKKLKFKEYIKKNHPETEIL